MQLNGVMLSTWQVGLDFAKLFQCGIRFIDQRVSYGKTVADRTYRPNVQQARKYGMGVIGFLFTTFSGVSSEIALFDQTVGSDKPDVVELDWETHTAKLKDDIGYLLDLSKGLADKGYVNQILYTNPAQGQMYYNFGIERLLHLPLSVANYDVGYPMQVWPWAGWSLWQYSKTGRLWGLSGNAVLEVSHLSMDQIIAVSKQA